MNGDTLSHGLWETTAAPEPATAKLVGERRVEVAIVGAGYTGLSAALRLAKAGVDVAVIEATAIGFGGSGRNVGLVNAGLWLHPEELPKRLGEVHGRRVLDLLGGAPAEVFALVAEHGIDCEATPVGTLHCAVGASGLADLAERERQWKAHGAPVRLLDAREAAAKIGSTAYAGALLDERAGTIQPLSYARGLARAALAAGAAIFTASPVTETREENGLWVLSTPQGTVRAERVIVATNAYSSGPWAELRDELVPLPYFNFATTPLPASVLAELLPERQGCWDTRMVLSSFRFDRAGRLVFGSVGALSGTSYSIHRAWAKRAMSKIFPALAGVDFEAAWYGRIGMTGDAVPRLHRPARNVVAVCGYNGRGIGPGTVFGRVLAEALIEGTPDADLPLPVGPVAAARFRAVHEAFYVAGAQIAHVADARF